MVFFGVDSNSFIKGACKVGTAIDEESGKKQLKDRMRVGKRNMVFERVFGRIEL